MIKITKPLEELTETEHQPTLLEFVVDAFAEKLGIKDDTPVEVENRLISVHTDESEMILKYERTSSPYTPSYEKAFLQVDDHNSAVIQYDNGILSLTKIVVSNTPWGSRVDTESYPNKIFTTLGNDFYQMQKYIIDAFSHLGLGDFAREKIDMFYS